MDLKFNPGLERSWEMHKTKNSALYTIILQLLSKVISPTPTVLGGNQSASQCLNDVDF